MAVPIEDGAFSTSFTCFMNLVAWWLVCRIQLQSTIYELVWKHKEKVPGVPALGEACHRKFSHVPPSRLSSRSMKQRKKKQLHTNVLKASEQIWIFLLYFYCEIHLGVDKLKVLSVERELLVRSREFLLFHGVNYVCLDDVALWSTKNWLQRRALLYKIIYRKQNAGMSMKQSAEYFDFKYLQTSSNVNNFFMLNNVK